jgi:cell division inhibitor SepF
MASLWQKTLFYLGLVDEDENDPPVAEPEAPSQQSRVRTVDPPGSRSGRASASNRGEAGVTRPPTSVQGRRVEPPTRQRRRISANPEHAEAGVLVTGDAPSVNPEPASSSYSSETEVIEARSFTDAQELADHIRDGRPVVLDLRGTEPAMVRRLVDFATGLTYALDGRMAKIAQGVILVTPQGRTLSADEQRRLGELGLYRVNA